MKCQKHGWNYAASSHDGHLFCSLCRDLKALLPEERDHINAWLAEHEEFLTAKSVSVFTINLSRLTICTEGHDGQPRLAPYEPIKGNVEADFLDGLLQKFGREAGRYESWVCIGGITRGTVRSAARRYGLSPSLVQRVRVDLAMYGTETATNRLLRHARRRLQETAVTQLPRAGLAAD